jgi:glycosyltransferase involved in cell wall biosynthesis
LIVSAHGTDAFGLNRGWQRAFKNRVLRSSAAWTANTQSTADVLPSASCVDPPRIIPMGVDLDHFSKGNRAAHRGNLSTEEFLLLFVGRLIENKGCHDLLRAFALLEPKVRSATKLWIVGDGDQKRELEQLSKSLGVKDAVRFTGAVPQSRLPDFYAAADLVVVPSRLGSAGEQEGQSVVVLEAFAARACVLASRSGGIPALVEDGVTGMFVEPGNPLALARALENLLNKPDLRARLAETAFSRVSGKYDWQTVAEAFSGLYREVAAHYRSQNRR